MARVTAQKKMDIQAAIVDLEEKEPDVVHTCGLCNPTLFDRLHRIEVAEEAPRKTLCDIFSDFYNEDKSPEEQISGTAFMLRMNHYEESNEKDLNYQSDKINNEEPSTLELATDLIDKVRKELTRWPEAELHQAKKVLNDLADEVMV